MSRFDSSTRGAPQLVACVLLLLLAATLVAGCASGTHVDGQGSAKLVTFSSSQYGFSIAHPAGWTQVVNPQAVLSSTRHVSYTVGWNEAAPSGATGGVAVGVLGHGARLSVSDQRSYVRYFLAGYRNQMKRKARNYGGYVTDNVKPGRIDGEPAVWVHSTGPITAVGTSAIECLFVVTRHDVYEVVVSGNTLGWVSAHENLAGTFHIQ
jgi:hypothetical protein